MNSPQAKYFRPHGVHAPAQNRSEVFHYGRQVGPEDAILKLRGRCAKEQEQKDRMVTVVSFRNGTLIKAALDVMHKCPDAKIAVWATRIKNFRSGGTKPWQSHTGFLRPFQRGYKQVAVQVLQSFVTKRQTNRVRR